MPKYKAMLGGRKRELPGGLTAEWSPGEFLVTFSNGRKQKVRYRVDDGDLVLSSRVATWSSLRSELDEYQLATEVLRWNRMVEVVAFVTTRNDAVEARITQLEATLQPDELRFYLATIAREADRLERHLTGRDIY